MKFKIYLTELKNRFLIITLALIATSITSYCYKEVLIFLIAKSNSNISNFFIFTNISEIFYTYSNLITLTSIQISTIYTIFHIFNFSSPALLKKEYFYIKIALKTTVITWIMAILIANTFFMPIINNFFFLFNDPTLLNFQFEARISEFLKFYVSILNNTIVSFQIFNSFVLTIYYNKITKNWIKIFRRMIYFTIFTTITLVISIDITSQIFISLIIISIIELLIITKLYKNLEY